MKPFGRSFLLALLVLGLTLGAAHQPARGDPTPEALILAELAARHQIPVDDLQLTSLETLVYPVTHITLQFGKAIDLRSGAVYGLALDESGAFVDATAVHNTERAAYRTQYGRLHPTLHTQLADLAPGATLTVGIWLRADDVTPLPMPAAQPRLPDVPAGVPPADTVETGLPGIDAARIAAQRAQQAAQRATVAAAEAAQAAYLLTEVSALQAPLLAELAALGYVPAYVGQGVPLVFADLPREAILALAERPDVDTIYGVTQYYDLMDVAKPTQKANVVDSTWGYDGLNIATAILEDSRIEFNNPYLNSGSTRVPGDPNVDQHATATAGMVASQHGTYQGIAQGVGLYSANATSYTDPLLSAAMDWAHPLTDIINNSWGGNAGVLTLNVHDRHLDWISRFGPDTVTVSAGNEGYGNDYVTSPARGYNVISVGAYDDLDTLTWDDDVMAGYSSWVDPSTGIEKPEVAASGSSINSTTDVSPWTGNVGGGTSYAAPMVAAEAALLLDRNISLGLYPESVKAIIMATALHNIEGISRLSEQDGAGGVDMRAAFRVVDEGWWAGLSTSSASYPVSRFVDLTAGETARFAIAWFSNPASDYSTDPLQADLDLYAYSPTGGLVASSTSVPNSFEIVEFTAATSGIYELRVTAYSFTGSSERLGIAWWPGHTTLTAYAPLSVGTPPVSYDYYRLSAASYWNAVGIRSPAGSNYNIYLYAASAFGDPDDHTWLEDSTLSSVIVDYVVVDRNHALTSSYYPEVVASSGTGTYPLEWATRSNDVRLGTYGPFTMSSGQVLRVWDADMDAGVRKYFAVKPTSGNADLGMGLHDSDPATASSYYQGRSQAVVTADANGAGGDEFMNYQAAVGDWYGLVVWNNGATTSTSFYLYADTDAPTGSVSVNGGAAYATSTAVTLSLSGTDAESGVTDMRFSNNGSVWSSWQPYTTSANWTLTSGDGSKSVYAQFRNHVNLISSSAMDGIVLDTTAPTGSVVIDAGAAYAGTTAVNLTLSASDGLSGVADMRFSNNGSSWSGWQAYAGSAAWTLTSGDGTKTVYAQYRDAAGNISGSVTDSIVLDTTGPTGTLLINGGDPFAAAAGVTLDLSASDAGIGVADMRFSDDGSSWSAWQAYAASAGWTLPGGDGGKTVYAQFRDGLGNVSAAVQDTIELDTTAPTGSVVIAGGAPYVAGTAVSLTLSGSDAGAGVAGMRLSHDRSGWGAWQSCGSSLPWTLQPGDGSKHAYLQLRDAAGLVSITYDDDILLDMTAPAVSPSSPAETGSLSFEVSWAGSDAGSGIVSYDVQYRIGGGAWQNWLIGTSTTSATFGPTLPVATVRGETYSFRVRATDAAGNISTYAAGGISSTVILEMFEVYLPMLQRS
ncbi:MAG: hypothetical protein KC425_25065 [Anaerolineales bacterium]|nr:hypothetical protein [Anaerolineales bacterium]